MYSFETLIVVDTKCIYICVRPPVRARFVDDERKHMVMEERYFFPLALATLTDEDWADIDAELYDEDDPLFDSDAEERFKELRREIMSWGEEAG